MKNYTADCVIFGLKTQTTFTISKYGIYKWICSNQSSTTLKNVFLRGFLLGVFFPLSFSLDPLWGRLWSIEFDCWRELDFYLALIFHRYVHPWLTILDSIGKSFFRGREDGRLTRFKTIQRSLWHQHMISMEVKFMGVARSFVTMIFSWRCHG